MADTKNVTLGWFAGVQQQNRARFLQILQEFVDTKSGDL